MARTMIAGVVPQVSRRPRHPVHPFYVKHAPYVITPYLIAPVLPGETIENISLQARVLTNPIKSALIGWWCEHYLFYCRWRDMADVEKYRTMVLDPTANLSLATDYQSGTRDVFYYWSATAATTGTGYNWLKACYREIVETYFRDEGEAWDVATIDSLPAAYVNVNNVFHSATLDTEMDVINDAVTIPVDATPAPDVVYAGDVAKALWQYQYLRDVGLTEATFEDWLRSFGVRVDVDQHNRPELLRYTRTWSYPNAHIAPDPTNAGEVDVSAQVSWAIAERADKKRFCPEPGFVIGLTVCRPKIYFSKQNRFAASLMDDAYSWLPAVLRADAKASWKKITDAATDMLAGTATGDWWVDIKDLLLHGDQFVNFDVAAAGGNVNAMAIPTTGLNIKFPVQASVDAMFVSGDATDGIAQDGLVRLHIMGAQTETSPRGGIL